MNRHVEGSASFEPLEGRLLLSSFFFLHQSVGQGILEDHDGHPGLASQLTALGHTFQDVCTYDIPALGGDSRPPAQAGLFFADTDHDGQYGDGLATIPQLAGATDADVLMLKSCFVAVDYLDGPAELTRWEQSFIDDVAPYANQHPQQKIVVMPTAPVRRERPYVPDGAPDLARQWADWLAGTFAQTYCTAGNVFSFNLYDFLADGPSDPTNANYLKRAYCRPDPTDDHPNDTGYSAAADALTNYLVSAVLVPNAHFVSPTGCDAADGSYAAPWQHVQYAVDRADQAGDFIFLRGGTYNESLTFLASGQAGRPITLSGFGQESVTLLGTGLPAGTGIDLTYSAYVTIENMTIQDFGPAGNRGYGIGAYGGNDGLILRNLAFRQVGEVIKLQQDDTAPTGHNILIEDIDARNYELNGIDAGPGPIDGLTIRDVTLAGPGTGNNTAIDGIAVESGQNITIENATVTGHAGDGIDLKADHVVVRQVTVTGQARNGIKLWGAESLLENSVTMDNGDTSLVLAGDGPYTLTNNLIGNTQEYDYCAVLGDWNPPGAAPTPHVIANRNIWISTAGQTGTLISVISGATFEGDYNLYYAPNREDSVIDWAGHASFSAADIGDGTWSAASGMDAHAQYIDPLLGAGYQPQAGSPAIDAAPSGPAADRNGTARPVGNGYDIGPFETGGSGPDLLPPTVAAFLADDITAPGPAWYDFTVTYTDNAAVSVASLDDNDVVVADPLGTNRPVHLIDVDTSTPGSPTATYRMDAPGGAWNLADNGAYTINLQAGQVLDTTGNAADAAGIGTFQVNIASDVLGLFGTVAGRANVKLPLTDNDGTRVTFSLSGPGTGQVVCTDTGWTVNLTGTDARSKVSVATKRSRGGDDDGRATLQDITVAGSLRSLTAPAGDLGGSLTVGGSITQLTLGDVGGGGAISLGANAGPVTVALGRVADLDLTSPAPLKSLTVVQWHNDDSTRDTITTPWIGSLCVKGDKARGLAGDFTADVVLAGGAGLGAKKATLGSVSIAGDLRAAIWGIAGDVGLVKVAGTVDHSVLRAGGNLLGLTAGASLHSDFLAGIDADCLRHAEQHTGLHDDFVAAGTIKSFAIRGIRSEPADTRWFVDSNLSAATVGTLVLCNGDFAAAPANGIYADASAAPAPIKSITYKDSDAGLKWSWPVKPGRPFVGPADLIHLL